MKFAIHFILLGKYESYSWKRMRHYDSFSQTFRFVARIQHFLAFCRQTAQIETDGAYLYNWNTLPLQTSVISIHPSISHQWQRVHVDVTRLASTARYGSPSASHKRRISNLKECFIRAIAFGRWWYTRRREGIREHKIEYGIEFWIWLNFFFYLLGKCTRTCIGLRQGEWDFVFNFWCLVSVFFYSYHSC